MFWEPQDVPAEEKYRTGCAEIMQVTKNPIMWNSGNCSHVQCRGGGTYTGFWGDTFYPTAGSPVSNPSKCEIYHDCSYSATGDFMVDVNTCAIQLCEHIPAYLGVGQIFPSVCNGCRNCTIIQKNGLYYSPTSTQPHKMFCTWDYSGDGPLPDLKEREGRFAVLHMTTSVASGYDPLFETEYINTQYEGVTLGSSLFNHRVAKQLVEDGWFVGPGWGFLSYVSREIREHELICEPCPTGKYANLVTEQTYTTDCSDSDKDSEGRCPQGCVDCPVGYYQDKTQQGSCLRCPPGRYKKTPPDESTGLSDPSLLCDKCPTGKYSNISNAPDEAACKDCPVGTYSNVLGVGDITLCHDCPAGTYGDETGKSLYTECKDCPKGTYSNVTGVPRITLCQKCSAGTYGDETGKTLNTDCKKCPAGTYLNVPGQIAITNCIDCPGGKWSSIQGSGNGNNCIDCLPGRYHDTLGSTSRNECKDCPLGFFATFGSPSCTPCAGGKYSNQPSQFQVNCDACPVGTYSESGSSACTECPSGWRQNESSKHECDACEPGFFQDESGTSECRPCPTGKYTDSNGTSECTRCPNGKHEPNEGSVSCQVCAEGRYSSFNSTTCVECPSGQYNSIHTQGAKEHDFITIDGKRYAVNDQGKFTDVVHGTSIQDVFVTPQTEIKWNSDTSLNYEGFKICLRTKTDDKNDYFVYDDLDVQSWNKEKYANICSAYLEDTYPNCIVSPGWPDLPPRVYLETNEHGDKVQIDDWQCRFKLKKTGILKFEEFMVYAGTSLESSGVQLYESTEPVLFPEKLQKCEGDCDSDDDCDGDLRCFIRSKENIDQDVPGCYSRHLYLPTSEDRTWWYPQTWTITPDCYIYDSNGVQSGAITGCGECNDNSGRSSSTCGQEGCFKRTRRFDDITGEMYYTVEKDPQYSTKDSCENDCTNGEPMSRTECVSTPVLVPTRPQGDFCYDAGTDTPKQMWNHKIWETSGQDTYYWDFETDQCSAADCECYIGCTSDAACGGGLKCSAPRISLTVCENDEWCPESLIPTPIPGCVENDYSLALESNHPLRNRRSKQVCYDTGIPLVWRGVRYNIPQTESQIRDNIISATHGYSDDTVAETTGYANYQIGNASGFETFLRRDSSITLRDTIRKGFNTWGAHHREWRTWGPTKGRKWYTWVDPNYDGTTHQYIPTSERTWWPKSGSATTPVYDDTVCLEKCYHCERGHGPEYIWDGEEYAPYWWNHPRANQDTIEECMYCVDGSGRGLTSCNRNICVNRTQDEATQYSAWGRESCENDCTNGEIMSRAACESTLVYRYEPFDLSEQTLLAHETITCESLGYETQNSKCVQTSETGCWDGERFVNRSKENCHGCSQPGYDGYWECVRCSNGDPTTTQEECDDKCARKTDCTDTDCQYPYWYNLDMTDPNSQTQISYDIYNTEEKCLKCSDGDLGKTEQECLGLNRFKICMKDTYNENGSFDIWEDKNNNNTNRERECSSMTSPTQELKCFSPPNFFQGEKYGNSQECIIRPTEKGQLYVQYDGYLLEKMEQSGCTKCGPGTFSEPNAAICQNCTQGKYSDVQGASTCTSCGPTQYASEGSTKCEDCPDGYIPNYPVCDACPAGSYGEDGSCVTCPAGYKSGNASAECTQCDVLQYAPEGSAACYDCAKGKYINESVRSECQSCPLGTYLNVLSSSVSSICQNCSSGRHQAQESIANLIYSNGSYVEGWYYTMDQLCPACPAGTFSLQGYSRCVDCPGGSYQPSERSNNCIACGAGKYSEPKRTAASQCIQCPSGFYSNVTVAETCHQCTVGTYANETSSTACLNCRPGFFQNETSSSECKNCNLGGYQDEFGKEYCKACSPGTYTDQHQQTTCKSCSAGQYQRHYGASACDPCEEGASSFDGATTCTICLNGYGHS